jgi:steroid 5-alpha reductase family enzyme
MLRDKTKKIYPLINFLGIHLFPTIVVYLCILPAVAVVYEQPAFRPLCAVFLLLSFAATVCQGIADTQMHIFRREGTGGFIRTGLWKHSRHPNYACEILMWWGIALASISAMPDKWFLCAGAAVNTIMFFSVSIPMADKRQSRKPGFEEYKKATRML